ncbi:hypothetical protein M0804_007708 [Polistes exclamans]|nr:hypothetical protein M0804_007708 [Polistes exclamans]
MENTLRLSEGPEDRRKGWKVKKKDNALLLPLRISHLLDSIVAEQRVGGSAGQYTKVVSAARIIRSLVPASFFGFDQLHQSNVTLPGSLELRENQLKLKSSTWEHRGIYILPNILSPGKWPRARAKLLNIQGGNEAKFVCVSIGSRH